METTGPRNRRITPSDLKRTQKALKKALRKERRRHDKMIELARKNEALHGELQSLQNVRNERNFPFECC
jgi:hypothetical protein